jgi:hypothetical protein
VKFKSAKAKRVIRKDDTIQLSINYSGNIHADPRKYNKAFALTLRAMADAIENITDAYVDPEVVVWMHWEDKITAEVILSPKE